MTLRSLSNADRYKVHAAALKAGRSFSEQYEPSKDDLRRMLAEAAKNTADLEQKNKRGAA